MRRISSLTTCTLALFAASSGTNAQAPAEDEAPARLRERAERPAAPASVERATPGTGNLLFSMVGADNAACVRSTPDVNGDGLDEVLVGIDESGVKNVFCLDGASAGAADVVWSIQTADGVSGGSPYGDQCIVPAADAEGSGDPNVLIGTAWGGRTAYDLDTLLGDTTWKLDTYNQLDSGWVYSLCQLSDVNGDTVPDAAFGTGSDDNAVYMIDGASAGAATVLWKWAAGDAVYSVRNIGDANGDGKDDVLTAVGDNVDRIVCLDGGTLNPAGAVLWNHNPGASVFACGVLPDVTGDGVDEALAVLWTLAGSSIRCLNGATGNQVWASTEVPEYGQMVDVLADVTEDGIPEVIVSSWENAVIVLDGSDGSLVWKTSVGNLNGGDVWTARAIDDVNGDGRQDVVAGSFDYHVYCLDGDTGEVFWAYDTGNRVFSVHSVGDLNGDGRPEVVAGTQDTTSNTVVYVLEGDADIPFPGLTLTGPKAIGTLLEAEVTGTPGMMARMYYSSGTASIPIPGVTGLLGLATPLGKLPLGVISPSGTYSVSGTLPNDPKFVGKTFHMQGLVFSLGPFSGAFTDVESFTITPGG